MNPNASSFQPGPPRGPTAPVPAPHVLPPVMMEQAQGAPVQYFSIDVECVANAPDHNSRSVAQISLVDQYERVLLNLYVRQERPVVSYLTPVTGLTAALLEEQGIPLQEALQKIMAALPPHAILVGQNIGKDIEWLGLKEGTHFQGMVDLIGMWRVWNNKYNSWSVYSQDHVAKVILGWDPSQHNAVGDAIKSIRLFHAYHGLNASGHLASAQQALLDAPPTKSFAALHPTFEGVCMGGRKTCTCGAPFFS